MNVQDAKNDMRLMPIINRDPDLLPFGARVYVGLNVMTIALICVLSNADEIDKLSACGLVVGIFGSGVLYWENVADNKSLLSIASEIERSADSRNLSAGEIGAIVTYANISFFLLFLLPTTLIFFRFKQNNDIIYVTKSLSLIAIISASPALSVYTFNRNVRRWGVSWLSKFRLTPENERAAYIKRFLRLTGFAALLLSGIMQLPAALF